MKGYFDLFSEAPIEPFTIKSDDVLSDEDTVVIEQPAKLLGSSIADGRYNGFSDGEAGLLHGMYDNDSSLSVDPLCDFATDLKTLKPNSSISSTTESTTESSNDAQ